MNLFYTDCFVIAYVDLETARRWWIDTFGCKQAKVPDAWDDSAPEDVALRLPGAETATILIRRAPAPGRAEQRPILFTSNISRARTHLSKQGVDAGLLETSGGPPHFEIRDREDNSIEICLDT